MEIIKMLAGIGAWCAICFIFPVLIYGIVLKFSPKENNENK